MAKRSYGNVALTEKHEYFQRGNCIYKALLQDPIMPDGYRCGRFACYANRWNDLRDIILSSCDIKTPTIDQLNEMVTDRI